MLDVEIRFDGARPRKFRGAHGIYKDDDSIIIVTRLWDEVVIPLKSDGSEEVEVTDWQVEPSVLAGSRVEVGQ